MKAIIIAAGKGKRLRPYTDDRPKCLVEIAGRSILAHQLEAYRQAGVDEIYIVRGYRKDLVTFPNVQTFDNDDFENNNILLSLFYAESAMAGGFLFSYADIVFRADAVKCAIQTPGDFALVIDRRWQETYVGRSDHPVDEAEVARVRNGVVEVVGKKTVVAEDAAGEFIGLGRVSATGAEQMRKRFHARKAELAGKPYGRAPRFEVAYLTDLFNDLISSGEKMQAAFIDGGWREIDTVQDLERARGVLGQ